MNNNLNFIITTLVTTMLSKFLSLDSTTIMLISNGLIHLINSIDSINIKSVDDKLIVIFEYLINNKIFIRTFGFIIFIYILYLAGIQLYKLKIYILNIILLIKNKNQYTELIIYNDNDIRDYMAYTSFYNDFYTKPAVTEYGDPALMSTNLSSDITNILSILFLSSI